MALCVGTITNRISNKTFSSQWPHVRMCARFTCGSMRQLPVARDFFEGRDSIYTRRDNTWLCTAQLLCRSFCGCLSIRMFCICRSILAAAAREPSTLARTTAFLGVVNSLFDIRSDILVEKTFLEQRATSDHSQCRARSQPGLHSARVAKVALVI